MISIHLNPGWPSETTFNYLSRGASALGKQQHGRQTESFFKDGVQLNLGFRNDEINHCWRHQFLGQQPFCLHIRR